MPEVTANKPVILGSARRYIRLAYGASHWYGYLTHTQTSRDEGSPPMPSADAALRWCAETWLDAHAPGERYHGTLLLLGATLGDWCAL